ncbi:MAG: hypothetical protein AAGF10_08040, partial [Verrucomicrobiota bacterium]
VHFHSGLSRNAEGFLERKICLRNPPAGVALKIVADASYPCQLELLGADGTSLVRSARTLTPEIRWSFLPYNSTYTVLLSVAPDAPLDESVFLNCFHVDAEVLEVSQVERAASLSEDDLVWESEQGGYFMDEYIITAGETFSLSRLTVDATGFSPVVHVLNGQTGEWIWFGDDLNHEGHARLPIWLMPGQQARVQVTSAFPAETGSYRLNLIKSPATELVPGKRRPGALGDEDYTYLGIYQYEPTYLTGMQARQTYRLEVKPRGRNKPPTIPVVLDAKTGMVLEVEPEFSLSGAITFDLTPRVGEDYVVLVMAHADTTYWIELQALGNLTGAQN